MKGLKMLIVNDAPKLKDYLKLRKTVTLNITVLSRIYNSMCTNKIIK